MKKILLVLALVSPIANSVPVYYCTGTITSTENIKTVESVQFDTVVNKDFGFDTIKVNKNTIQYDVKQTGENFGMRLVLDRKTLKGVVSYTINDVVLDTGNVLCNTKP